MPWTGTVRRLGEERKQFVLTVIETVTDEEYSIRFHRTENFQTVKQRLAEMIAAVRNQPADPVVDVSDLDSLIDNIGGR